MSNTEQTGRTMPSREEPVIHFVGEQDGESERALKSVLHKLFVGGIAVNKAYLARVRYGNESVLNIALALVADSPSRLIVAAVENAFHSMFSSSQHLDVLFVNSEQEKELSAACRPFFVAVPQ